MLVLVLFGFLPWVDNFAHVFGFVSGFLISLVIMPYITFNREGLFYTRKGRIIVIVVSLLTVLGLFAALLAVFYALPGETCEACKFFSCIPFTQKFCADQNINFAISEDFLGF